jgi:zinc protease
MAAPGVYLYPKAVNQARVCALLPGILRDRPDHPAIEAMNEIFGGGGFTSRLTNRIRTEAGLAYSVGSSARGGIYFPNPILAAFQTKSRTALYAISLLQDEIRRITTAPVSDRELETARRSLVDTFPENFASADKTAALFASDELTGRFAKQPDYWKTYRARVEAVTADDVLRVARELLQPAALRVLIVGEKDDVLRGDTDHPVQVSDLKLGEPHPLPERDPLTLEPTR